MKKLSNEDKLQIMDNAIEPLIKGLSPDVIANCITATLKAYLNSDDAIDDEDEMRDNTIYSSAIAVRLFNLLYQWYED